MASVFSRRLCHSAVPRPAVQMSNQPRDIQFCDSSRARKWTQYDNRPPDIDPSRTSILLFPGQGAQFVGMGRQLIDIPKVKEMFQCANEVLRTNLLRICLEGPQSKLDQTIHCQPATYVIALAAATKLFEDDAEVIRNCVATAGFSLGEITSLVFAGALTFEQGLQLVRVRAEAMQRACEQTKGAMTSVFISHDSQLKLAMLSAVNHCKVHLHMENPECRVANYLYSDCKVIAGNLEAVEFVEQHADQFSIRRCKRLPVSGAFHTALMRPATRPFSNVLSRFEQLQVPRIPVVSAVDVSPYRSVEGIKRKLSLQLVKPVLWEQTLHALYARPTDAPFPRTVEFGPGKQLGSMLRMVNRKAFTYYQPVNV
ncbi:[acyl-carrier-protein] S-malonyltransferase [Paragonimus westermani]|uniref:[acyl-carrier-protein] S-malonyltransferase n=1 Tax=Paragonimus westermani TaxID=34504 RepID=A0A5J4NPC4_9TREM|nr:[acyl-carrier-protein] S-malonyltransferase [Paragonimus westermani]